MPVVPGFGWIPGLVPSGFGGSVGGPGFVAVASGALGWTTGEFLGWFAGACDWVGGVWPGWEGADGPVATGARPQPARSSAATAKILVPVYFMAAPA